MPADPAAVAAYLAERAEQVSPAAVRLDRASIAAAHRACAEADPCVHEGVRQVMRGISRTGRDQGRGQVAGLDWRAADLAAGIAANEGHSLAGLRDASLIMVGSDALLRVSEIAALTVADVQVQSDGSGTVTIHASKTDQEGRGHTRYLGAPTVAAVQRWMQASGISAGPLFVRVRRGDVAGTKPLDVRSIRSIIAKRAAAAGIPDRISGHSLRVGSAQSLAGRRRRSGRAAAGRRLEGAADAGPLRAAPVRRPRCGRQAALPGRSVGGRQGALRTGGTNSGPALMPAEAFSGPGWCISTTPRWARRSRSRPPAHGSRGGQQSCAFALKGSLRTAAEWTERQDRLFLLSRPP